MHSKKRALIFGITGQDGTYLADLLLKKGYAVYGTSRNAVIAGQENLAKLGIDHLVSIKTLEITDAPAVADCIREVQPSEIYYLCGPSSVALSARDPASTITSVVSGVTNILNATLELGTTGIRIFNAASGDCYGTINEPVTEKSPFNPLSPYAIAKVAGHYLVRNFREEHGLHCCSGFLFNHESRLRTNEFIIGKTVDYVQKVRAGYKGKLEVQDLSVVRDWGWAPEYVEAIWGMLQLDSPTDMVIATGESASLEKFIDDIFRAAGLAWQDHVVSSRNSRPLAVTRSFANPSLAKEKIGWATSLKLRDIAQRLVDGLD